MAKIERWSKEEIKKFDELQDKGLTLIEIGFRIGKTLEQCKNRRYKVSRRKDCTTSKVYSQEAIDKIFELRAQFKSHREISIELKISEPTIAQLIFKHKHKYPEIDEKAVKKAIAEKIKKSTSFSNKGALVADIKGHKTKLELAEKHFAGQFTNHGSYYILNGKKMLMGQFITAYLDCLRG